MTEQTNPTPTTPEEIEAAKKAARAAAEKRLRDTHGDDLRRFMIEEHAKRGVTYRARLTPEERARQEIARLAAEHGISVALDVETIEDGAVEVNGVEPEEGTGENESLFQRLRGAAEQAGTVTPEAPAQVPEGTPVVDGDASPEERRRQAATAIFGEGSPNTSGY
jgi:hypothetical protein